MSPRPEGNAWSWPWSKVDFAPSDDCQRAPRDCKITVMIFRRRKYPLPKFPGTVASTFQMLCAECAPKEIEELRAAVGETVKEHLARLAKSGMQDDGVEQVGDCCCFLLDKYQELSPKQRQLVIGAVRYFAVADDPFDDQTFASGLYDDKRVLNHVLEELGIEDRYLDVS